MGRYVVHSAWYHPLGAPLAVPGRLSAASRSLHRLGLAAVFIITRVMRPGIPSGISLGLTCIMSQVYPKRYQSGLDTFLVRRELPRYRWAALRVGLGAPGPRCRIRVATVTTDCQAGFQPYETCTQQPQTCTQTFPHTDYLLSGKATYCQAKLPTVRQSYLQSGKATYSQACTQQPHTLHPTTAYMHPTFCQAGGQRTEPMRLSLTLCVHTAQESCSSALLLEK